MANNRYIITKSNYTLKKKHKSLNNGSAIYERDYMTTTNLGGWDSGVIPHSEGGFKFVHNVNSSSTKSCNNGNWLSNDGSTVWTLSDVTGSKPKEESQIVIKTNKNSFDDFVYFGSCVELIKTSIENIIKWYPAEIYITSDNFYYTSGTKTKILGSEAFSNPVVLFNPFGIDLTRLTISQDVKQSSDYNELRYFVDSFKKYRFINDKEDTSECFSGWHVTIKDKRCYEPGELISNIVLEFGISNSLVINEYYFPAGNVYITDDLYSGWHIRPVEDEIYKVFTDRFSAFERFLLNRDSNPLYTIEIDVPSEDEYGISRSRNSFTLPTIYGWNINLDSGDYNIYLENLLTIARFYDEHYTNNLWENIVHEAIKNMDINFSNPSKDEDITDYRIGIDNIHGLMLAYARQFDDIKLSIENIKSSNTVSYDGNNNIPDYFLSDELELAGWEVSSVVKTLDDTVKVSDLFPGSTTEYTTEKLNTEFMRNLKINSRSIFSRKGTRQSIEMLLALFGLSSYEFGRNYYNCLPESSKIRRKGKKLEWDDLTDEDKSNFYDYKFDEYVVVAHNNPEDVVEEDDTLCVEEINEQIKPDSGDGEINALDGLPVRMVYLVQENESGETTTLKYIIPWFDKNTEYDGKTYFQMYGGWCKIEDADGTHYTETLKYLKIIDSIETLSGIYSDEVSPDEIYYVNNISDYNKYYPTYSGSTPSHYFYLHDPEYTYKYKDYSTDSEGWEIIPEIDIKNRVRHGIEVYQLESIINEYRGNNPHVGFGKYDDGDKYLERLAHVFDGAIDDGLFTECVTCHGEEIPVEEVKEIGFTLTDKLIDNIKCWYFVDSTSENKLLSLQKKYITVKDDIYDEDSDAYEIFDGYEETSYVDSVRVGASALENGDVHMTTELNAFNLETQEEDSNDEAAANSIINIKNLTIEFNKLKYNSDEFEKYLHEVILFYLNQIIPTTSILTVKYFRNDEFETCYSTPVVTGVSK